MGSETEEGLECCHRSLAAAVAKHELGKVNLEPSTAHAVVGASEPLLQVPICAIC